MKNVIKFVKIVKLLNVELINQLNVLLFILIKPYYNEHIVIKLFTEMID